MALQNKDGTGNSTSAWLLVSPHPPQLFQVSPSSFKHIHSNSGQQPIFQKKDEGKNKTNKKK